jgi:hypothetical protein
MFRDLPFRSHAGQLADCAAWLALFARPGAPGRPVWSYRVKHLVQAWACGRYVSSRSVVEAARLGGYPTVGTPTRAGNAWLALAVRRPRDRVP